MSATGRSDVRRADDFYATPAWCVKAIWPKLHVYNTCLDPCAGEGRILLTLQELASTPMYRGIEIDEERATLCATQNGIGCVHGDALGRGITSPSWRFPNLNTPYDLVIMNPPYSLALEFIQAALHSEASEIAVLLRVNFLASNKRAKFWRENPCDVFILPKRPSFAIFMSCKEVKENGIILAAGCGWKASYPPDAFVIPETCPECTNPKLMKCTSDATEYMWAVWPPKGCQQGRGHWEVLNVAP